MSLLTTLLLVWEKMVYLQLLVSKYGGKCSTNIEVGERWRHPWEDHTYQADVHVPLLVRGWGPSETGEMWKGGYHCRWRASMSCSISSQMCGCWYFPRFLSRRGMLTDKHGLLYGPGDVLGLLIHGAETVQLDGMTCGVGMVINRGGGS